MNIFHKINITINTNLIIIYIIAHRNNINLNTIENIHERKKIKIKQNSWNNVFSYCCMIYKNNKFKNFTKILNKITNNIKIDSKINDHEIKHINNINKNFTKLLLKRLVYLNLNVILINCVLIRQIGILK
jgi:hypothetical protein